jgi:uncharacterized protein
MAMKIQVGGLSQGSHSYNFRVQPADIGLDGHYTREIVVSVGLEKTATQIMLKAELSTQGQFSCDRCADEFTQPLAASYRMHYIWNEEDAGLLDPTEVQLVASNLAVIDLAEDVRQTIILAVPLKLLCKSSCKGLCPRCGRNLNLGNCTCSDEPGDSRWEALRSLRTN